MRSYFTDKEDARLQRIRVLLGMLGETQLAAKPCQLLVAQLNDVEFLARKLMVEASSVANPMMRELERADLDERDDT